MRLETQKSRVREILRSAPREGVCSLLFYSLGLPNGRNRVCELRDNDGLDIETRPCPLRQYHSGEGVPPHVRYLWHWAGNPRQMRMAMR
ncbi:MAG: hypothetical protein HY323_08205 [Betaproteobacteria bacterium]|nr:hypothetical protein [Betaproteobacteria bacterium]